MMSLEPLSFSKESSCHLQPNQTYLQQTILRSCKRHRITQSDEMFELSVQYCAVDKT
jgi:hypothetical protein